MNMRSHYDTSNVSSFLSINKLSLKTAYQEFVLNCDVFLWIIRERKKETL